MPTITLRVTTNTTFKQDWRLQSNDPQLQQQDKYFAQAGQQLRATSIDRNAQKYGGDHWLVTFEQPLKPNQGTAKSTWYVYAPHIQELSGVPSNSITLRTRTSTTFKQDWREQSSNLAQQDKYFAQAGQQFRVSSIDRNAFRYGGDHWKVTLVQPLQPNQGQAKSTWYVYVPDVQLFSNTSTSAILRTRTSTTFKQDWREQSSNLAQQDKYFAQAGQQFRVSSIDRNAFRYGGDHWKITFVQPLQPNQGQAKSTWYVYVPDVIYESPFSQSNTETLPNNINIIQYLRQQIQGNTSITPFPPEDYRLGSRGAGEQGSRGEEITSVILHWEGSKPVTEVSLLSPSLIFLLCFLCTSAVRLKKFCKSQQE